MRENKIVRGKEVAKSPAEKGADLFIAASVQYPASVACQAAEIVRKGQKEGITHPDDLLLALVKDDTQIDRLLNAADDMHRKKKIKITYSDDDNKVRRERLKVIAESVMEYARDLKYKNDEALNLILSFHPKPAIPTFEDELRIETIVAEITRRPF